MNFSPRSFLVLSLATAFLAALLPATALGVSANPELLEKAKHDPVLAARIAAVAAAEKNETIDTPSVDRIVVSRDARGIASVRVVRAPAAVGQLRSLAILLQFADRAGQTAPADFDFLLFGDVYGPASVRGYYNEISYGKLSVTTADLPSSLGWITLPHSAEYYAGTENGIGDYPNNAAGMVADALPLIDAAVDFSHYDTDGDGTVDNLIIIHSGEGAEATGASNDIWSHKSQLPGPITLDGVAIESFSTEPEFATNSGVPTSQTVGIFAHEIGHILGLRDLYDTVNTGPAGIGEWSLMAGGNWLGPDGAQGASPARLDAWSASQIGWVLPTTISSAPTLQDLPAVEASDSGTVYRVVPRGGDGTQYFLVENRQKIGTDSYLPGDGALVWHVDENAWSDNDDPEHKLVALEEADGFRDLDMGYNRGDPADPFPGTADKHAFSWATTPNSRTYAGADTAVYADRFSSSQATMTVRIGLAPTSPTAVKYGVRAGGTLVAWTRTTDALGYRVYSGASLVGSMGVSSSSLFIKHYLGPSSRIAVVAVGDSGIRSASIRAAYKTVNPTALGTVHFANNSAFLSASARTSLRRDARLIAAQGFKNLTVHGHNASTKGSAREAQSALSLARAKALRAYLASRLSTLHAKVTITVVGYGGTEPIASNATASGRAKNRRAELILK